MYLRLLHGCISFFFGHNSLQYLLYFYKMAWTSEFNGPVSPVAGSSIHLWKVSFCEITQSGIQEVHQIQNCFTFLHSRASNLIIFIWSIPTTVLFLVYKNDLPPCTKALLKPLLIADHTSIIISEADKYSVNWQIISLIVLANTLTLNFDVIKSDKYLIWIYGTVISLCTKLILPLSSLVSRYTRSKIRNAAETI
jgi:hypothetical protein